MKTREEMRFEAAKAAMQGILSNCFDARHPDESSISSTWAAKVAVCQADALLAELDRTAPKPETPSPDADGWIEHRPGDPMPCDGDLKVFVRLMDGMERVSSHKAKWWAGHGASESELADYWKATLHGKGNPIIAWKPA